MTAIFHAQFLSSFRRLVIPRSEPGFADFFSQLVSPVDAFHLGGQGGPAAWLGLGQRGLPARAEVADDTPPRTEQRASTSTVRGGYKFYNTSAIGGPVAG